MKLIPVLDLKGGHVVHACRGERSRYRPIVSTLCSSSAPYDIVKALLNLFPFPAIYLADLDAIAGIGAHVGVIETICGRYPRLELWVDSGISDQAQLESLLHRAPARPVIGSETLLDVDLLQALYRVRPLLSLDFMEPNFRGPPRLLDKPALWPDEVIVMQLDRVGSGLGPDCGHLREIQNIAPTKSLYAAGGVRGKEDLLRLAEMGLAGALIASALHDGTLGRREIEALVGG